MMFRPHSRRLGVALALGLALTLAASGRSVLAQDADAPAPRSGAVPKGDVGGKSESARGDSAKADAARSDPKGDQDATSRRLSRLEEQFIDIQVSLGTLESLVKTGPAPVTAGGEAAPSTVASADSDSGARLQALETQVGALTAQIEQLSQTMSGGRSRSNYDDERTPQKQNYAPPADSPHGRRSAQQAEEDAPEGGAGDRVRSDARAAAGPGADASAERGSRFGEAGAGSSGDVPFSVGESPYAGKRGGQQSIVATAESDAKSLYAEAYGNLLERDYGEAEAGFRQLLASYPNDAMAGNAQYWLGETFYARGEYKESADAFLKGYRDRPKSQKAPDSLLKLGMSLAKLGEKDAACSTLGELKTKFPNASDGLKERAEAEKKRASC